jgi:hypothetical protein
MLGDLLQFKSCKHSTRRRGPNSQLILRLCMTMQRLQHTLQPFLCGLLPPIGVWLTAYAGPAHRAAWPMTSCNVCQWSPDTRQAQDVPVQALCKEACPFLTPSALSCSMLSAAVADSQLFWVF